MNPRSLCFAHIDPSTKHPIVKNGRHELDKRKGGGVNRLLHPKFSVKELVDEIRKCEVLCVNCHHISHYWDLEDFQEFIRANPNYFKNLKRMHKRFREKCKKQQIIGDGFAQTMLPGF